MDELRTGEMGQNLSFARVVARKGFIRCDADMNDAGIVAYIGYFCRGRTFSSLEFLGAR